MSAEERRERALPTTAAWCALAGTAATALGTDVGSAGTGRAVAWGTWLLPVLIGCAVIVLTLYGRYRMIAAEPFAYAAVLAAAAVPFALVGGSLSGPAEPAPAAGSWLTAAAFLAVAVLDAAAWWRVRDPPRRRA